MRDLTGQPALAAKEKRVRDAIALRRPDRVPVIPGGPTWPSRVMGMKMVDMWRNLDVIAPTIIEAYAGLGDIDGIQHPTFHPSGLSLIWLTKVKLPGRELPDDELWQVEESGLMTADDYDAIVNQGWRTWLDNYHAERLPGFREMYQAWAATVPGAIDACWNRGILPFSPAIATIPFEYFVGGRGIRQFMLDLYRDGDRVQAAMDAAMPAIIEDMRQMIRGLDLMGLWAVDVGRGASEFLAPKLWERFVFPYAKQLVDASLEEGAIPVLHFDADWTRDLARLRDLPKGKCVLSLDGKTDIFKAKEILGDHMCIMGDVPASLFSLGTPDDVAAYCQRLIKEIGPEGFILSSGCDVPVTAKYENVRAMVEAVL